MAKRKQKRRRKVKHLSLADLTVVEYNPKTITEDAMRNLMASVKENTSSLADWKPKQGHRLAMTITVNRQGNRIVGGAQRTEALERLGQDWIHTDDVTWVDLPPNGPREKALNVALNNLEAQGDFDQEQLNLVLADIQQGQPELYMSLGFGSLITGSERELASNADDAPPLLKESVSRSGELYVLGEHRVLCGDATKIEDVERVMNGEKADMVFTDPPYGVNVKGGARSNKTIAGDLTQVAIPFSFDLAVGLATKADARFYFCGSGGNFILYDKLFERFLNQMPRHLIWVKNGFVLKPNNYHNQYEVIFFGYKPKGGGLDHWFSGRTEDEASDVWRIKRDPAATYLHPTQKPVELFERGILNSSPPQGNVYDPFLGSGSALIACERTGRRCYGMEIDPHYVDVVRRRWAEFVHGSDCNWKKLTPRERKKKA